MLLVLQIENNNILQIIATLRVEVASLVRAIQWRTIICLFPVIFNSASFLYAWIFVCSHFCEG